MLTLHKSQKGKNHPRYKAELTDEDRQQDSRHQYTTTIKEKWRLDIFNNNDFTCQICNKRGSYLNAHHLDGWDKHENKRFDVNNGVTMCTKCHKKFHKAYGHGKNTKEQWYEFYNIYHSNI
jgi:5-methylcytosine-specific restriction endonuclease McrA